MFTFNHSVRETLEIAVQYQNGLRPPLSESALRSTAPAVFAEHGAEGNRPSYTFISTSKVVSALRDVGFEPVYARQTRSRRGGASFARHLVRLRRRLETVEVGDAHPELVLLNSHNGSAAYQLRAGMYRPVCRNGLMVSLGAFAALYVQHRGDVLERVVTGALEIAERFGALGEVVQRMQARRLDAAERIDFAERALELKYDLDDQYGMRPSELLTARREMDVGDDLWRTLNVTQEILMRGGLRRMSTSGRLSRSRAVSAVKEEVRLNTGLWEIAVSYLSL